MIRQPFLHQSAIPKMNLRTSFSSPSCMLMSPMQISALKSAFAFSNEESDSDDLEELCFEESKPLVRKVRLDYVSDYEWDEDNESLTDYEDDDDVCSVDSEVTLAVSNKTYGKQLSPTSSATNSTATISSDCSISSVASFDSEVAVSRHHQPSPIYHRHSVPNMALSPPSARKEIRHSFSNPSSSASKSTAKKPFVRPDLMPTPLKTQSFEVPPPSPPRRKSPIGRRLFRTSSARSTVSIKTI